MKLRCTVFQFGLGVHHEFAIDQAKFNIAEQGLDPEDFTYLCYDHGMDSCLYYLFIMPEFIELWRKSAVIDMRHIGPESEIQNGNEEVNQFPEEILLEEEIQKKREGQQIKVDFNIPDKNFHQN